MSGYEPKVVGFLCNWCSYAGADKAGAMQTPQPPGLRVVRVMCSGRVEPEFVLEAFERGADGVVVMACHPGDCHYKEGNTKALGRARLFSRLLRERGVEPERFAMHYVSAAEGDRFVQIVTDMVDSLRALGPLRRTALEAG